MATVNPSHDMPLSSHPTETKGTVIHPTDKIEALLKSCEDKGVLDAQAQKVVDWLDQVLNGKLDRSKGKRYFTALIKICKAYRFVPTSHLVLDTELEKLGDPREEQPNSWPGSYEKLGKPEGEPEMVSINVLSPSQADYDQTKRHLCGEAVTWKRMSHPNILPFIGVTLSKELAIVSPWMENGNVLDYLKENLDANPVKLLEESAAGLRYLHNMALVHGDIRSHNVLVTDEGHACLANFGQTRLGRDQGETKLGAATVTHDDAALRYSSPERHEDQSALRHATKQSDIYSMGMMVYEVLTDKKPFEGKSSFSAVVLIIGGERPQKPNFLISRGYTQELWDLTTACWGQNPAKRPEVGAVFESLSNAASQWKPRRRDIYEPST